MKRNLTMVLATLVLAVGLFGLSHWSGYTISTLPREYKAVVTMLTPVGLLRNLVIAPDPVLKPYYYSSPPQPSPWDSPLTTLLVVLTSGAAALLVWHQRGSS